MILSGPRSVAIAATSELPTLPLSISLLSQTFVLSLAPWLSDASPKQDY